jgi:hypothetical protein
MVAQALHLGGERVDVLLHLLCTGTMPHAMSG